MADRNTELRQLKEMLREVQQIDNLEKQLNEINKRQSQRDYRNNAPSTINARIIRDRIKMEKSEITESETTKVVRAQKSISSIYWWISIISIIATALISIAIFNPVSEEVYATEINIFNNTVKASTVGYGAYIILTILVALIIAIIANPCISKKDDSKEKSSDKK